MPFLAWLQHPPSENANSVILPSYLGFMTEYHRVCLLLTAEPEITYHSRYTDATSKLKARSMRWHEVHAGLSVRF